jgi:cyclic peptide transporter
MIGFLNRRLVILLSVAALTSSVSALLTVTLFSMVSRSGSWLVGGFQPLLYIGLWCVLLLVCVGASAVLSRHSAGAVFEVRTGLIRRILGTEHDKLEKAGNARLYNVLTVDVNNIANSLCELPTLVFNAILLSCCLVYLALLSLKMFAVLAVAITVAFVVSKTLIGKLARHARAMRERQDTMLEAYRGLLDGSAQLAIDVSRKAAYYDRDLQPAAAALREEEQRFRFFWDINRSTTSAIILLLLGVFVAAGRVLADGDLVVTYTLLVIYCAGPFAIVLNLMQSLAQAQVSMRKIATLQISPDHTIPAVPRKPAWQRIRWSDVRFVYSSTADEQFALGPLSLELRRGEVVFITGGNGSGKSTLLKLLLGLQQPTSGTIHIDDVLYSGPQGEVYQSLFSIVLSEFHLFNAVLGSDGAAARDADVQQLLERFNLAHVVRVENGRFSTVALSQGQRKRLALVAALAQDKDIYVLDEWAADQDPHYRQIFYREIIPWMRRQGKTVIAVTHDDRYFDAADSCIELEIGRIRAQERRLPQIAARG